MLGRRPFDFDGEPPQHFPRCGLFALFFSALRLSPGRILGLGAIDDSVFRLQHFGESLPRKPPVPVGSETPGQQEKAAQEGRRA